MVCDYLDDAKQSLRLLTGPYLKHSLNIAIRPYGVGYQAHLMFTLFAAGPGVLDCLAYTRVGVTNSDAVLNLKKFLIELFLWLTRVPEDCLSRVEKMNLINLSYYFERG